MNPPTASLSRYAIFFDFDNTLTSFDVLDDFIRRFAVDRGWMRAEKRWREGKIGSRECLEEQLACLRVTRRQAERYLEGITPDPSLRKLLEFLRLNGVEPVVLSDSFYFLIDRILKNGGITGLRVFSNQARFHKDRILPYFSDRNRACFTCANCKKRYLLVHARQHRPIIYTGDGRSDLCASSLADIIFAKGDLARHLEREKKQFIPFRTLADIYRRLKNMNDEKTEDGEEKEPAR